MPAWVNNQQNAGPWQVYFHQLGFSLQAEWVFALLLLCFSGLVILFQFLWRIRKFIWGSEEFRWKMQQMLLEKPWNSKKNRVAKGINSDPILMQAFGFRIQVLIFCIINFGNLSVLFSYTFRVPWIVIHISSYRYLYSLLIEVTIYCISCSGTPGINKNMNTFITNIFQLYERILKK